MAAVAPPAAASAAFSGPVPWPADRLAVGWAGAHGGAASAGSVPLVSVHPRHRAGGAGARVGLGPAGPGARPRRRRRDACLPGVVERAEPRPVRPPRLRGDQRGRDPGWSKDLAHVARGPNVSGSSHLAPSYLGATIPRRLVATVAVGMCPSRHPVLRAL